MSRAPGRVLVLGLSARAAAESAARAGCVVTSLDAFADRDLGSAVRVLAVPRFTARAAERAARSIASDAVVYLSPFENHPAVVQALSRGRALWGNTPDVLRRVRDPQVLRTALDRLGFEVPRGAASLLKPVRSGGGQRITPWRQGDPIPRGTYVQPRVDGEPWSIVFVSAPGGAVALGLSRQIVGDPAFGGTGFRYCGSLLDSGNRRLADRAAALASGVSREFGLVGVNGIDFIRHGDEPVALEVNPRWSASMELVERATGGSIFGVHLAACTTGTLPIAAPAAARIHGKAIVFARRTVTIGDTTLWLDDPDVRDVPHSGERISAGRPVCTVFASGDDAEGCYEGLVEKAGSIYRQLDSWQRSVA